MWPAAPPPPFVRPHSAPQPEQKALTSPGSGPRRASVARPSPAAQSAARRDGPLCIRRAEEGQAGLRARGAVKRGRSVQPSKTASRPESRGALSCPGVLIGQPPGRRSQTSGRCRSQLPPERVRPSSAASPSLRACLELTSPCRWPSESGKAAMEPTALSEQNQRCCPPRFHILSSRFHSDFFFFLLISKPIKKKPQKAHRLEAVVFKHNQYIQVIIPPLGIISTEYVFHLS